MQDITAGVDNPNSVVQMKAWLSENGVEAESLGKKKDTRPVFIKRTDIKIAAPGSSPEAAASTFYLHQFN